MKKNILLTALVLIVVLGINATLIEKDPLHGKTYEVIQTEYKDSIPKPGAKPLKDEIFFKNGKLFSDIASEKLKFEKMIKYEITKDSSYSEGDEEKRYYEIEGSHENDDGQTLNISIKIDDINIEGSMKLMKGDKLKKYYEFTGKEKAKKAKK